MITSHIFCQGLLICLLTPLATASPLPAGGRLPKKLIKKHDKMMDKHSSFMLNYGTAKLKSLNEAGKLLQHDSPLYHREAITIHGHEHFNHPNTIVGEPIYDNSDYHASVKGINAFRKKHQAYQARNSRHLARISDKPDVERTYEAVRMQNSLDESATWHRDHPQDPLAKVEILSLKRYGRHRPKQARDMNGVGNQILKVHETMNKIPRVT